jgi:MFS family permease
MTSTTDHGSPPPTPGGALWQQRDFLLLWSGQAISLLGTSVSTLAFPLLVLALTHSPAQAGLTAATQTTPYVLFSLPAGALVDRWNRKMVMILCDGVRLLAYGSVPLLYALGHLVPFQLYLVAFCSGTAFVFFNSAQVAALPRVVPSALVPQATAWNASAESAATLIGPALSGLIISLAQTIVGGTVLAYLLDSISYLISGLSLSSMRTPFQEDRPAGEALALRGAIAEGLRFLWHQPRLRVLAFLLVGIGVLSSSADLALIVLAQHDLHADEPRIGLIFSLGSAGGLLGSLAAGPITARVSFGRILTGTTLVEALAVGVLAAAISPLMLMLGLALISLAIPIFGVTQLSYRLSLIPDALQGRLNSVFDLLFFGSQPLGMAVGGFLLSTTSPRLVLLGMALGLVLVALIVGVTAVGKATLTGRTHEREC